MGDRQIVLIVCLALYMLTYNSSAQEDTTTEESTSDDDDSARNTTKNAIAKFVKRFRINRNATHFGRITHRELCENYAGIIVTKVKRSHHKNIQATCDILENPEAKDNCTNWMNENFSPSPSEVFRNAQEVLSFISVRLDTDSTPIISIRDNFTRDCENQARDGISYNLVFTNSCIQSITTACELADLPYVKNACKVQFPALVCR